MHGWGSAICNSRIFHRLFTSYRSVSTSSSFPSHDHPRRHVTKARKAGHGEEQGGGGCRLAVYYASKMLEPSSWGKRSYCLFSLVFMPYTISWQNKYFTGTEFCHAKLGRKMFDNATWCVTHDFIYYFSYKFFFRIDTLLIPSPPFLFFFSISNGF